jgi:hypothetical protein
MKFEQRDANEHGDIEWILLTDDGQEHPMGITIFHGENGSETPRIHHAARRRGGGVADGGAGATTRYAAARITQRCSALATAIE